MEFRLLGPLAVLDDQGNDVPILGIRLRRLLAALVMNAGTAVSVDRLAAAMWEDEPPANAGNALQSQVSKLRRLLTVDGASAPLTTITATASGYRIDIQPEQVDVVRFERHVGAARAAISDGRLDEASAEFSAGLSLWRGEAFADFVYDDFARAVRANLEQTRLAALEERIDADLASNRHAELVAELETLVIENPFRERMWGQLMVALYRSSRQAEALQAFQRARETLRDELGIDPGAELTELERRILDQDRTLLGIPAAAPVAASAPNRRNPGIVAPLGECIGRDADIATVTDLLQRRRLITLTGPGGVGKTRLALEVASRATEFWPNGGAVVDLAAVTGASRVEDALERACRVLAAAGAPGASKSITTYAIDVLRDLDALLVFDNCEHVLESASSSISALLGACPRLRVIATTREPLGISGEAVHTVQPLDPDDAAQLFTTRAQDASSSFVPDDSARHDIDTICRDLDCLPLAIELAAARMRAFTVAQLVRRLRDLTSNGAPAGRGRAERHQTLMATVAWSHDLLFEDERRLLARLSVFAGSFTISATEIACADDQLPADIIPDVLGRLVDKSLVIRVIPEGDSGHDRYRLLWSIAEFAAHKLDESGETARWRDAHLRWCVARSTEAQNDLRGGGQRDALRELPFDEPDLQRGVQWSLDSGRPLLGLSVLANLGAYAWMSLRLHSFTDTVISLLEATPDATDAGAVQAMAWAGMLRQSRDEGVTMGLRAVDLANRSGDPRTIAIASLLVAAPMLTAVENPRFDTDLLLSNASAALETVDDGWLTGLVRAAEGVRKISTGRFDDADAALDDVAMAMRAIGDEYSSSLVAMRQTEAAEMCGDLQRATLIAKTILESGPTLPTAAVLALQCRLAWFELRAGNVSTAYERAASTHAPIETSPGTVRALRPFALGAAAGRSGNHIEAIGHLREAAEIWRSVGMHRETVGPHSELGRTLCAMDRLDEALAEHTAALAIAVEWGANFIINYAIEGLIGTLVAGGQMSEAAVWHGAYEAVCARAGFRGSDHEEATLTALVAHVEGALGPDAFAAAVDRGGGTDVATLLEALPRSVCAS